MIGLAAIAANKLKFTLIEHEDGIVAITEQTNPHVVIGIFDLTKHIGVPFLDLGKEEEERIGKELIRRLNTTTQGEPFILGGGALGWPIQEEDKNTNTSGEVGE